MQVRIVKAAMVAAVVYVSSASAFIGVSFHWGLVDNTLSMESAENQKVTLTNSLFNAGSMLDSIKEQSSSLGAVTDKLNAILVSNPVQFNGVTINNVDQLYNQVENSQTLKATLPITISRKDLERSPINFGGKVFLDKIRIIDAIEFSFNFGVYQYESKINYPAGVRENISQDDIRLFLENGDYSKLFTMKSKEILLSDLGLDYLSAFGITKTPLVKNHIDLSIRKNLFARPRDKKYFKIYLGGGPSLDLSTPVLTPEFVDKVINDAAEITSGNIDEITEALAGDADGLMKVIVKKLTDEAKNPTFGIHFIGGTMVKFPVVPLGIYLDGKFLIPFGDIDETVDLGGMGLNINAGVAITF